MEDNLNSIKLIAGDFSLEMRAKIFKGDPVINNTNLWVKVVSGNFSGAMQMEVGSLDLEQFVQQICSMNNSLKGRAHIEEPYGNSCFIDFKMNKTGHIKVSGKLKDFDHHLDFENVFDQTYLPGFVKDLCNTDLWQEVE
ncbi:MAG: hypothetical protein J5715_05890 [Clostridiales bacterium]|nr:hypothetical protein [Clostridiales bacterium]